MGVFLLCRSEPLALPASQAGTQGLTPAIHNMAEKETYKTLTYIVQPATQFNSQA